MGNKPSTAATASSGNGGGDGRPQHPVRVGAVVGAAVGASIGVIAGLAAGAGAAGAATAALAGAAVGTATGALAPATVGTAAGALAGAVVGMAAGALAGAAVGTAARATPVAVVGMAAGAMPVELLQITPVTMPGAAVRMAAGALAGSALGTAAGALAGSALGTAAGAFAGALAGAVVGVAAGVAAEATVALAVTLAVAVAVSMAGIGVKLAPHKRTASGAKSSSEGDLQPLKRSQSFELLPPNMSELRVVLLGSSWSQRSSVGNFILRENQFNTEEEPDCCLRASGGLKEKQIVLINTPDLLRSWRSNHSLCEACRSLSGPGPHVFLLVLQPEDFTEEHKENLCSFLELYSDRSFDHSLVLISTAEKESSAFMERCMQHAPLKEMIEKCKSRFLWRGNLELAELLTRLEQVVKENNGEHV